MRFSSTFRLWALSLVVICSLGFTNSLKLNPDGGYEVTIAIDEGVKSEGNTYISSIKGIFTSLSNQLFRASKGTFYIRKVDIVVPSTWTSATPPVSTDAAATIESFETSDIRVSDAYLAPFVENPNTCGRPGEFIQFPTTFFAQKNGGPYGEAWKALLNQWARYRWGVWEEHGLPGNEKFPYSHKVTPKSAAWSLTGCSNEEIKGSFMDDLGDDPKLCNASDVSHPLEPQCRFVPDPVGNTATSSLMHFHFVESVTDFCDETNHDRTSPNKQNYFCGYKSVWEVIRETPDYIAVKTPISDGSLPVVQFKTVGMSAKPVLYILLDNGNTPLGTVRTKLRNNLVNIFNRADEDVVVSIGSFPGPAGQSYVQERVSWTPISTGKDALTQALRETVPADAPENRDFGLAILEAVQQIKLRKPPGGAVLLVVKTGAGKGSFGTLTYEEEVLDALLNERINLLAAEIQLPDSPTKEQYVNLKTISKNSDGNQTVVTASNVESGIVNDFVNEVVQYLGSAIGRTESSELIYKGQLKEQTMLEVFLRSNIEKIHYSLTYPANAKVGVTFSDGSTGVEHPEWDEQIDASRRIVKPGSWDIPPTFTGGSWFIEYKCYENCLNLVAQLVVRGSLRVDPAAEALNIIPYTSAVNNVANLNETKDNDSPFTIFARVTSTKTGAPVANLSVQAVVHRKIGVQLDTWTVPLVDDGLGTPDFSKEDGIYSGTFIPPADGSYRITVRVINDQIRDPPPPPPTTRLLPEDQFKLVCATPDCEPVSLTNLFETSVDMPASVSIINRSTLQTGKPTRITDLTAEYEALPSAGIRLKFTSPKLVGTESTQNGTYFVYLSKSKDTLLTDLNHPEHKVLQQTAVRPAPVGGEYFLVQNDLQTDTVYVGIVSVWNLRPSDLSIIPMVEVPYDESTTPIDQSTTPDPNPGTTQDPTATTETPTDSTARPTIPTTAGPPSTVEPTDEPTTTTKAPGEPEPEEESKPFFETAGGIVVIVAIVLIVLAAGAGLFFYCYRVRGCYNTKKKEEKSNLQPSSRPQSQSPSPRPESRQMTNP